MKQTRGMRLISAVRVMYLAEEVIDLFDEDFKFDEVWATHERHPAKVKIMNEEGQRLKVIVDKLIEIDLKWSRLIEYGIDAEKEEGYQNIINNIKGKF